MQITEDLFDVYFEDDLWNLRLKNNITELSSSIQYNILQINDLGNKGKYNYKALLNIHLGTTFFYHNPKGSIYGSNNWVFLQPLQTENIKYISKYCNFSIVIKN